MTKKTCAVAVCNNTSTSDKSLSWHRFPKSNEKLRKLWIKRCRRADTISINHGRICSAHFTREDFHRGLQMELMGCQGKRFLKPTAVPSLHLKPDDSAPGVRVPPDRKRKVSTPSQKINTATSTCNSRVIAKSKRTRKVDDDSYMTEEIVFEVEGPLANDNHDVNQDSSPEIQKTDRLGREKGVYGCTIDLVPDLDDVDVKNAVSTPPSPNSKADKTLVNDESALVSHNQPLPEDGGPTNWETYPVETADHNYSGRSVGQTSFSYCTLDTPFNTGYEFRINASSPRSTTASCLSDSLTEAAAKVFTPNQLEALMKKKKRILWTDGEILEAIKLRFYSLPMYTYLRKEKGYPFPGKLAISRWAKKMNLRGGILHNVLHLMKLGGRSISSETKDFCVLSLKEMKVLKTIEYDEIADDIIGPSSKMQIMMAASLSGSWRQPVFVNIDSQVTKDTVINMISALFRVGFHVGCFSSDCSDKSVGLWSDLGATADKPFFSHPYTGRVVVVPDALHAMHLLRVKFLETGFHIEGSAITRAPLDELLKKGVCSELKSAHLRCDHQEKIDSDAAAQLFSSTIGAALICHKPGDPEVATSTGNFFKVISYWFSMMNAESSKFTVPFQSAYGHKKVDQDKLLNHVKGVISSMKFEGRDTLLSFQRGIIMSCNGLPLLYDEVNKNNSNIECIVTQALNHTALHCLFSHMRHNSPSIPSPLTVLSRLRMNLFGKNVDPLLKQYLVTYVARQARINITNTEQHDVFQSIAPDLLKLIPTSLEYISVNRLAPLSLSLIAERINLGFDHRYNQLCKCHDSGSDGTRTHEPTDYFMGNLIKMEKIFESYTRGRPIPECKNIVRRLRQSMKTVANSLPGPVIKLFVRLRIEIYVQSLLPKQPQIVIKRLTQSQLLNALRNVEDKA